MLFVWLNFFIEGISFIIRQRGFDMIAYLFYDKQYLDIRTFDLSSAPYWLSLVLGLFCIGFSFKGFYENYYRKMI